MLRINLDWIPRPTSRSLDFFGPNAELETFRLEKDRVRFYILHEVFQHPGIAVPRLIVKLNELGFGRHEITRGITSLQERGILNSANLAPPGKFSREELERYKWQLEYFASFESQGVSRYDIQYNLKKSRVAIIGVGGQGSIVAQLLAAMGVGDITAVDGDVIEMSNLTRQVLYQESDIGHSKTLVLGRRLVAQNGKVHFHAVPHYVQSRKDLVKVFEHRDMVILCADRPFIKLREWVNDIALKTEVPYIGVSGMWVGPLCVPFQSPCFECEKIYYRKKYKNYNAMIRRLEELRENPWRPSFGFRPVISGTLIALQVAKFLSRAMTVEVLAGRFQLNVDLKVAFEKIPRSKRCPACGGARIRPL